MSDLQQLADLIDEVSKLSNTVGDTLALLRETSDVGAAAVDIATHNNDVSAHAVLLGTKIRYYLTRNTTFYVRPDGNDNNDGSADTPASALKTIAGALSLLRRTDQRGYQATISLAPGNWPMTIIIGEQLSGIIGITSTDPENQAAIAELRSIYYAHIKVGNLTFSGNGGQLMLGAGENGIVEITAPLIFKGSAVQACLLAGNIGFIFASVATTVFFDNCSAPATVGCRESSDIAISKLTFSGSNSGVPYAVNSNGVVNTGFKGPTFIPGTGAGTTINGGVYL